MRRKSFTPWLVAAVVFGPFVLATLLYYGPWGVDWLPRLSGSRELFAEPVPLPEAWAPPSDAEPVWSLIYARSSPCEAQCAPELGRLLAVQLALGRDQDRVRRLFLFPDAQANELDDPALVRFALDAPAADTLRAALGTDVHDGQVYVADPEGRVILSYPADVAQRELLRDLKRLISVSRAG